MSINRLVSGRLLDEDFTGFDGVILDSYHPMFISIPLADAEEFAVVQEGQYATITCVKDNVTLDLETGETGQPLIRESGEKYEIAVIFPNKRVVKLSKETVDTIFAVNEGAAVKAVVGVDIERDEEKTRREYYLSQFSAWTITKWGDVWCDKSRLVVRPAMKISVESIVKPQTIRYKCFLYVFTLGCKEIKIHRF